MCAGTRGRHVTLLPTWSLSGPENGRVCQLSPITPGTKSCRIIHHSIQSLSVPTIYSFEDTPHAIREAALQNQLGSKFLRKLVGSWLSLPSQPGRQEVSTKLLGAILPLAVLVWDPRALWALLAANCVHREPGSVWRVSMR